MENINDLIPKLFLDENKNGKRKTFSLWYSFGDDEYSGQILSRASSKIASQAHSEIGNVLRTTECLIHDEMMKIERSVTELDPQSDDTLLVRLRRIADLLTSAAEEVADEEDREEAGDNAGSPQASAQAAPAVLKEVIEAFNGPLRALVGKARLIGQWDGDGRHQSKEEAYRTLKREYNDLNRRVASVMARAAQVAGVTGSGAPRDFSG